MSQKVYHVVPCKHRLQYSKPHQTFPWQTLKASGHKTDWRKNSVGACLPWVASKYGDPESSNHIVSIYTRSMYGPCRRTRICTDWIPSRVFMDFKKRSCFGDEKSKLSVRGKQLR